MTNRPKRPPRRPLPRKRSRSRVTACAKASSTTCAIASATRSSTPTSPRTTTCGSASAPTRGVPTGEALKAAGFTFFGFVSAIDWMPSPYGKGEDDPTAEPVERDFDDPPGRDRRRDPLPGVRPRRRSRPSRRRHHQGRRPRRRGRGRFVVGDLRRRELARARVPRDVRHRLQRPSRPAQHVPADRIRGLPAAQGLPAARPHGQAVAGHRRRRADARRRRRRTRSREARRPRERSAWRCT